MVEIEERVKRENIFLSTWGLHADKKRKPFCYDTGIYNSNNVITGYIVRVNDEIEITFSTNGLTVDVNEEKDGFSGAIVEPGSKENVLCLYKYDGNYHSLIDTKEGMVLELSPIGITAIKRTELEADKKVTYRGLNYEISDSSNESLNADDMKVLSSTIKHFYGLMPQFFEMKRNGDKSIIDNKKLKQLL